MGQEFVETIDHMIIDGGEDVDEIGLRVETVRLRDLYGGPGAGQYYFTGVDAGE